MQMIDVLKKLAELDGQPSTIAEESLNIDECGMMPAESHSPAHISMSAGSGHELADMLSQIMTLAGSKQDKEPLSSVPGDPAVGMTAVGMGPKTSMEPEPGMAMRSIIDTMNDKVSEYDNTPADPTDKNEFDADQHANQENQPGQGDRMDGTAPKGNPTMEEVEQDLFSQYKQFLEEN